eukprot:6817244-Pyramimonas_sp.AAC.1
MAVGTRAPAVVNPRFPHCKNLFLIGKSGSPGANYILVRSNSRPDCIRREGNFPCRPLLRKDHGPHH